MFRDERCIDSVMYTSGSRIEDQWATKNEKKNQDRGARNKRMAERHRSPLAFPLVSITVFSIQENQVIAGGARGWAVEA